MTTIKNTGKKIINVGTTALMPDATMKISEVTLNSPAMKAFVKKGAISVLDNGEATAATDEAAQSAETTAETTTSKTTSSRKKSTKSETATPDTTEEAATAAAE